MSKDMLGSVVRAMVGVPQDRLELMAKMASALAKDNPRGGEWKTRLEGVLVEDLPIVEAKNTIIRTVVVDRSLTGKQAIDATGRRPSVSEDVVITMPTGKDETIEIVFFKEGRNVQVKDLEGCATRRGLVLLDPIALCAFNAQNPEFADEYPNATQWKDTNGNDCCALFDRWSGGRYVYVDRSVGGWDDHWWFAARKLVL